MPFPKSSDLGTVATSLPAKAGQMAGAWGAPRAAAVVGVMGISLVLILAAVAPKLRRF